VLGALGAARWHQQNFPLFVAVVVGLALATVAVYLATAPRAAEE
jgi:hypothetical protein